MGYRPVGVYPNHIFSIISYLSSILQDRNLYQPGGVSYGVDVRRAAYEMIPQPNDTRRDGYPSGGIPEGLSYAYLFYLSYHIHPIYPILPTLYPTG